MIKKLLFTSCCSLFIVFAGCSKDPVNDLVNPSTNNSTGNWLSGKWVIFDDELKTNGAVMLYTEGMSLDFNCASNPHSGSKCIKFSWTGLPAYTYASLTAGATVQSGYTGFGLICAPTLSQYFTSPKNLSLGGYTKITFWARGSLSQYVYLRAEANSTDPNQWALASGSTGVWQGTVTSDWQPYSIKKIDNTFNNLSSAVDFVKFILVYDEDGNPNTPNTAISNGGTVYIDDVQLTQ